MSVKSTNIIHALPYPVLEAGNLSFPQGSYEPKIDILEDGCSIEIEHKISGAAFIEKLIREGSVQFYCLFSAPKTGIRTLHETDRTARIEWEASIVGQPPRLRPMLVYTGEDQEYELTQECGVAELWRGKKIILPKGARLARGSFVDVNSSEHSFLRFSREAKFERGRCSVFPNHEEGFYFTIKAAPDVFDLVQRKGMNAALRSGILTGVVCHCFSILKYMYKETEDDSNEFPNLKTLSAKLERDFGCDWNDDDFDPMLAATTLYRFDVSSAEDE